MPEFAYTAKDRTGRTVENTIQAENSAIAAGRLREQGYEVLKIRALGISSVEHTARRQTGESLYHTVHSGVPLKDLMAFYRQLSALVNAGIPIFQALTNQENQVKNARLRTVLRDVNQRVQNGEKLSSAFGSYPSVFNELQIEMLRAAEHGGLLEHMLARCADYLERELEMRRLISGLTLYPKLVMFVAYMVLGKRFFIDKFPAVAKLIVGLNNYSFWSYMNDTFVFLLEVGVVVYVLFVVNRISFSRAELIRETWERFKMAIPGVGGVTRGFALAKFGRSFGVLYGAGLPMATAVRAGGTASGSRMVQRVAEQGALAAERGGSVSDVFAQCGMFPHTVVDMLRTGEQTGNIDAMMAKSSEYLENEAETKARQYAMIFSVVVLLTVAVIVGYAIVTFYMSYVGAATGANGAGGAMESD